MSTNMHEDLIVEIFSRLPSKSLVRFRSVSKSLCARIGSSSFIKLHTLHSPKKVMMIHEHGCFDKKICTLYSQRQFPNIGIPIEYPFTCRGSRIVGSCNGLACIYDYGDIFLWNPSIRRQVKIREQWDDGNCVRGLSGHVSGFGFDPISEDYKILRISEASSFVYTVKTNTWRKIAPPSIPFIFVKELQSYSSYSYDQKNVPRSPPCVFNGVLHWAVRRNDLDECDYFYHHYYIMTFDLSSEVFSKIELPEPTWEIHLVTIIKDCLAVITSDDHHDRRHYGQRCIWVRTATSWTLAYKQVFETPIAALQITPNDELLHIAQANGVFAYNLGTNEISRVVDFSKYLTRLRWMCTCEESLELLDTGILSKKKADTGIFARMGTKNFHFEIIGCRHEEETVHIKKLQPCLFWFVKKIYFGLLFWSVKKI